MGKNLTLIMLWKKITTFLSAFVINTAHRRNIWQNCISISFSAEIVITRESLYIMNMLEKIQSQLEHLSKSERKVAEVILASPDNAIHSSIAALALEANVSEPTVNRFCRSMDTRGFPDFKLHLAQSLANGTPYVNRNVNEDDSVESYTGKIFESAMATLDHVRHLHL